MSSSEIDVSVLNNLIEIIKDGQHGFKAATEDATDPDLKRMFQKYAEQREEFAGELQNIVLHLGQKPEQSGTVGGAVHRGWINLKAAAVSRDNLAVLEECERGEDHAVAAFRDALASEKLGKARTTVQTQADQIKMAHDAVRDLRNRYKGKAAAASA